MKGAERGKVRKIVAVRKIVHRFETQDDYLSGVGKQRSSPFLSKTTETKIKRKWADTHSGLFHLTLDQNRKELRPTAQNVEKTQIHVRDR